MKKILLIEDEFYILDLYKRILMSAGFAILTAFDGEQGLKMAKLGPDLILLDIMLPKLNGIMVLKQLKSDPLTKNIPVVIITNLGQEVIIKQTFDLGAQGYFLKVRLKVEDLVSEVNKYLADPSFKMDYQKLTFD